MLPLMNTLEFKLHKANQNKLTPNRSKNTSSIFHFYKRFSSETEMAHHNPSTISEAQQHSTHKACWTDSCMSHALTTTSARESSAWPTLFLLFFLFHLNWLYNELLIKIFRADGAETLWSKLTFSLSFWKLVCTHHKAGATVHRVHRAAPASWFTYYRAAPFPGFIAQVSHSIKTFLW